MTENKFLQLRTRSGTIVAALAALISLLYAVFLLPNVNPINNTKQISIIAPQPDELAADIHNFPCTSDTDDCSIGSVYSYLLQSFGAGVQNIVVPPTPINLAWFFRLQMLTTTIVVGLFYFRRYLVLRDIEDEKENRQKLFERLSLFTRRKDVATRNQFLRTNLVWYVAPLLVTAILLTYILSSGGALLLSVLFKGLMLTPAQATILSVVMAAAMGYLLVHWLSAANTRDLLHLSLLVVLVGLGGCFYLADEKWWLQAISTTGIQSRSAPLLTLTLICLSLVMLFLMRDVANIFTVLFDNLPPSGKPTKQQIDRIYSLWIVAFVLIAFIGLFPNVKEIPVINWLHMVGAAGAPLLLILAGKGWFTLVAARRLLPRYFRYTTVVFLLLDEVFFFLWLFNGLNLTAFELWLLTSIGIWFYSLVAISLELIDELDNPNIDSVPIGESSLYRGLRWTGIIAVVVVILALMFG